MAERRAVHLIDGDDAVLVAEAARASIDEAVGDAERSLVLEDFRDDEIDLASVADAAATPPFLSDRRVVVVRDIGRFGSEEVTPLVAYLEHPLPTTSLILVGGGGRVAPRLMAAVKAQGHVSGTSVRGKGAKTWVHDRIKSASVHLDGRAAAIIEAHLGEDVSRLTALLELLGGAFPPRTRLGPDDIEPYLGAAGAVAPWDLTDAIDGGNTAAALSALRRLLEAGERHPLVMHAVIARHIGSLLRVDGPLITTEEAAAKVLGITPGRSTFPAKKALTSARRYGSAHIAEATVLVADAEVALKGGRGDWPGDVVLEVVVARLCRLARQPRARR